MMKRSSPRKSRSSPAKRTKTARSPSKSRSRSPSKSRSRSRSRSASRSRSRSASPKRMSVTRRTSVVRSPGKMTMTRRMSVRRSPSKVKSAPRRMSGSRKGNAYMQFAAKYRRMYPMRGVPVPQQGKMIGAAYRRAQGRGHMSPSPVRVPASQPALRRMSPQKSRRSPSRK